MNVPGRKPAKRRNFKALCVLAGMSGSLFGCDGSASRSLAPAQSANSRPPQASASASNPTSPPKPAPPVKVEVQESAMGTSLHFIAFTNAEADEPKTRQAIDRAIAEMRRLEGLMSEWRDDSEIGKLNANSGEPVAVSPETLDVIRRGLEAGKLSKGTFDITFQSMSDIWKFGGAADATPKLPTKAEIDKRRKLVDYTKVELDAEKSTVRLQKGQKIGLGGIAKGYIVDRAAGVLKQAGVKDFLVQAGGDLFGSGHKPDGSAWVSGIQDPRGAQGSFFASIELTDHAFSTAGDYARSYIVKGKRYHHIIDPRTGQPATACRSVTIWAPDATTADVVDDAVFILGPEQGLEIVASLPDVGAVIVDKDNKLWVSERLKGKVQILRDPSDGI
jgi:FAD:protein FMN transferase